MSTLYKYARQQLSLPLTHLEADALGLFTDQMHGHMGKWEYEPSLYKGDPAGGAAYWSDLVCNPGHYYPTKADYAAITKSLADTRLLEKITKITTVIELGTGGLETIQNKTLPFLQNCLSTKQYIAVDHTFEFADFAAQMVRNTTKLKASSLACDFLQEPIQNNWEHPCAFVMWGGSIGNIPGNANHDPFLDLKSRIKFLGQNLKKHDLLVITFDTEYNEQRILAAYNEIANKSGILSPLHLLKRDGLATGNFDPRVWVHEPVWFPDVMQCVHTIYPMFDQTISIGGHIIKIPAWRRFVSNNSYKFKPATMIKAAEAAGLWAQVIQHGPMAMLIAQK